MANGYMEALQRKNNPSQNMKGVSVGVKTDIGQETDGLTADEQAMIDNIISTMSDKDKSFYKREVRSKMRSIEASGKKVDKNFNYRAKPNTLRNEKNKKAYEDNLKIMKKKAVADEKASASKKEKKENKAISKAEKEAKSRDNIKIDLDVFKKNDELFRLSLKELESKAMENTFADQGLSEQQQAALDEEKRLAGRKYMAEKNYMLEKAIEQAYKKFNNDTKKVLEFFESKGLGEEFKRITNRDPNQ